MTTPFGGGTNPNVAGQTTGLAFDDPTEQAFASFGSIILNTTTPVDFLTVAYTGTGTITASGLVAENNLLNDGLSQGVAVGAVPGDFDGDGFVGLSDLNILGSNFGTTSGATVATGDATGDGMVDLADLNILGSNFNPPPAVAVPEPSTAVLALVCLGFAFRRK